MLRAASILGFAACATACGDVPNPVRIDIGGADLNASLRPFLCRFESGMPNPNDPYADLLISRVRDQAVDNVGHLAMVLDVLEFESVVPSCAPVDLSLYCERNRCRIATEYRRCIEISVPLEALRQRTPPQAVATALTQLRMQNLSVEPPESWIALRTTFTTQRCADLMPTPTDTTTRCVPRTSVVGCALTCPLVADQLRGAVSLHLVTPGSRCESDVNVCNRFFEGLANHSCRNE